MPTRCFSFVCPIVVLCFTHTLFAQGPTSATADSLLKQARTSTDTGAARIFGRLADLYVTHDAAKSLSYIDSAFHRAKRSGCNDCIASALLHKGSLLRQAHEYRRAQAVLRQTLTLLDEGSFLRADAFLETGITLLRLSAYDSALIVLEQGVAELKHHPNVFTEATLYNVIGNVFREKNLYQQALANYIKSAGLFEQISDNSGLTQALSNIGNLHNLMDNPDRALEYARKSLEIARKANVKSSIAYSHRLMGRIYRKQQKPAEALSAYGQAVVLYRELQARQDLGETLLSMANVYYDLREFNLAIDRYRASIDVFRRFEDSSLITYAYAGLAYALEEQKKYTEALRYLDTTLRSARDMKILHLQMDAHQMLSRIHEKTGAYKASLADYQQYASLRDSIAAMQNRSAAEELEARYQTEKKDHAIRLLEAENKLKAQQLQTKNNLRNYLVLLLGLCVVIIAITYNRYQVKNRANKKLKEIDDIKSRFFTNVSHEFRTPLSLIIGPLQEKLKSSTPQEQEELSVIYRSAKQLQDLIDELLDLSRLEAGSLPLNLTRDNLSAFLKSVVHAFSPIADRNNIVYTTEICTGAHGACYDREKLRKMVNNLLSNAFKFTSPGGSVHFSAHITKGLLHIIVKDSGRGIPADKLKLVFTRFYRVDETGHRATEGNGIGLALVKEFAQLHRGDVTVTSQPGKGTTFSLTIPVTQGAYADMPVLTPPGSPAADITAGIDGIQNTEMSDEDRATVLLAEDNIDMQDFIRRILHERYHVTSVADGRDALEKAKALVPDLIISDWMMPGMDGRTLCEKIKTDDATCHIPVLMLTAKADQASKIAGLETGADDYLIKPFDTQELQVRVHNLIDQRKRLRNIFSAQLVLKPEDIVLSSRDTVFISKVMQYLETNYSDPTISVDTLAQAFNMSRMQLHRKLKALADQSPGDFIRHFRLERAKQLLAEPGVQVSEVCFRVGFSSVSNFSKAFREYSRQTPTEFMNAMDKSASPGSVR